MKRFLTLEELKMFPQISISRENEEKIRKMEIQVGHSKVDPTGMMRQAVLRIGTEELCYKPIFVSIENGQIFVNIFQDVVETSITGNHTVLPIAAGYINKEGFVSNTCGTSSSTESVEEMIKDEWIFVDRLNHFISKKVFNIRKCDEGKWIIE